MRFQKTALALFACLVVGATSANTASAVEGDGWTVEGTPIPNGIGLTISCEEPLGSTLVFTSTLLGSAVELSAGGFDCVETTIDNTTSKGHSEGRLRFTGVKVLKPSTKCSVKSVGGTPGTVTTEALTGQVIMDPTIVSTVVFDKIVPEVSGGPIAYIEFAGSECPLNEASAPVKGTACGESPNKTGVLLATQALTLGASQQATGGCALTLGTKPAQMAGSVRLRLTFLNEGKAWGAD